MKILSNKKYNDLISKQFRGIFADVNDDNLLRENGLLYGENKELQKEIVRLNNIINKAIEYINENWGHWCSNHYKYATETINILKGSDSNE